MSIAKRMRRIHWVMMIYAVVLAAIFYPALREQFSASIVFWNCLPPTIGFAMVVATLRKSRRGLVIAAAFAITSAIVSLFFFATWFFMPLDSTRSAVTALVFTIAPIISAIAAISAAFLTWLALRIARVHG